MKYFTPAQLLSWNNEFDIFISQKVQNDEQLIKQLYVPFPLTGQKLVWGFPLIKRAQYLGVKEVMCQDFQELGTYELMRLALLIEDRKGSYTWQEKENMVLFCEKHNLNVLNDDIVVLIENHSDPEFLKKTKRYIGYPGALKSLLNKKLIDAKTAERVSRLPQTFFQKLLSNEKKFTYAERRIFCHYIFEIVERDKLKSQQKVKLIQAVFSQTRPFKKAIELRYPKLTGLEKRLGDFKKQYLSGSGVVLHEPPYFEGNAFTLSICFENKQQYEKKIDKLVRIKENIHELFGLLH